MSKPDVVAIMHLETWFKVVDSPNGTLTCHEDSPTCAGALNMLCARNVTGNAKVADTSRWWAFEDCFVADPTGQPGNAAACAAKAGVDPHALSACVGGALGKKLFAQSAAQVLAENVPFAPWFVVNGKVPTGGVSKLKSICDAFAAGGGARPAGCDEGA